MQGKHEGSGIVFPPTKIFEFCGIGRGSKDTADFAVWTGCRGLGFIALRVGAYGLELEVQRSVKEAVW